MLRTAHDEVRLRWFAGNQKRQASVNISRFVPATHSVRLYWNSVGFKACQPELRFSASSLKVMRIPPASDMFRQTLPRVLHGDVCQALMPRSPVRAARAALWCPAACLRIGLDFLSPVGHWLCSRWGPRLSSRSAWAAKPRELLQPASASFRRLPAGVCWAPRAALLCGQAQPFCALLASFRGEANSAEGGRSVHPRPRPNAWDKAPSVPCELLGEPPTRHQEADGAFFCPAFTHEQRPRT